MESVNDSIEIGMYAACLADNYCQELYEKSQRGYISALDEITAWAHEFYNNYYEKLKDWDSFEESPDNIYKAICWDDFVIEWGIFGAYNGVTGYFQNIRNYKDEEIKLKSLLYGGIAQMRTQKAFDLCFNLANTGTLGNFN